MKKSILNITKPLLLLIIIAFTVIACDEDFVTVESDITGVQNFSTSSKIFPFIAYNKKLDQVQTNNLPSNVLGVYKDPNYGTTTASIVAQIVPDDLDPDFGDNPSIVSVKLYIPYYSTLDDTDDDGNSTYELDSLYGDTLQNFKLSVYSNKYYLRNLDPELNFEESQAYYSSSYNASTASVFEDQLLYSNPNFSPSAAQIRITELDDDNEPEITERKTPGLYIDLNNAVSIDDNTAEVPDFYWKNLILDNQDQDIITNTASFKDFFRGLIIKAEATSIGLEGSMPFIDLSSAEIVIEYEFDDEDSTTDPIERDTDTYSLSFSGISFNAFENLSNFTELTDGNATSGDDQLFVKGFQGSMTILDLFNGNIIDDNNNTQDALEYFKSKEDKWLLNEANLNFYVDQTSVTGGTSEPDRIVLYDLGNNIPILDYYIDATTSSTEPVDSKLIYSPKLERDEDNNGVKYKIRLTEHLNRILYNDSTNVKLGLYVSTNVNQSGTSKILDALDDDTVNIIPQSSIIAPEGTILYGNTPTVPDDVKATFEIFYTEPEN